VHFFLQTSEWLPISYAGNEFGQEGAIKRVVFFGLLYLSIGLPVPEFLDIRNILLLLCESIYRSQYRVWSLDGPRTPHLPFVWGEALLGVHVLKVPILLLHCLS
jgi:hypothetical protein